MVNNYFVGTPRGFTAVIIFHRKGFLFIFYLILLFTVFVGKSHNISDPVNILEWLGILLFLILYEHLQLSGKKLNNCYKCLGYVIPY